jgi:chemotaxis protein methyltransferase CheR
MGNHKGCGYAKLILGAMATQAKTDKHLEDLEIKLLLEGVYEHYGYDFREYATASLRRRILNVVRAEDVRTISALQERILHQPECLERFVGALSVNVTAMFRDAEFYQTFRKRVVPILNTYPSLRIWLAGCSTGEEVYSLAIMLHEAQLLKRSTIYATDLNQGALEKARAGNFPLENMQEYTANYHKAGGIQEFSDYYRVAGNNANFLGILDNLEKKIVFAQHNLVTDAPFNQFHIVWCRNVLIYFNKMLQQRVHKLLYDSLVTFGALGLGMKETIKFSPYEMNYRVVEQTMPIYRKVGWSGR